MKPKPDDVCPRPEYLPSQPTQPAAAPLYTASVYRCDSPDQASKLLAGELPGYVYSRDGHPNADLLAEKCRELHGADQAAICGSGMAALAAAVLSQAAQGDHLLVSNQLYGRSTQLLSAEAARLGIDSTLVDACDLEAVAAALRPNTRLLVVETIANPLLRVADLAALAALTAKRGALLLVDNTFASPAVCRPLEFGADLVLESLTKIMSGHSDVLLGLLCGRQRCWQRVPLVLSAWGLSSSPFDCWMASRGLGTMALRVERAATNAMAAAQFLAQAPRRRVRIVSRSGCASRSFAGGSPVRKPLWHGGHVRPARRASSGGSVYCLGAANSFLPVAGRPEHDAQPPCFDQPSPAIARRTRAQGIRESTIRLSVGIEAEESVLDALGEALDGMQRRLASAS